ncbi:unnamed protein product [Candidula unifasciata]|uniref:BRCT domain-containing protein n=1 Tax=Candidula unifasciata TaxID=100452 RepID=A0A8S3ZM82_9EUPU|nr:unnamed protein product [Candidula unifasciata]
MRTAMTFLSALSTGYDRVCDRTLKFFQGVAYKCWVVAFPWVLDSLQTGSLLPEENYEIVGDTSGGENTFGAKHSRLSREHLFTDFCLACVGDSREMPKESLHELLTVCGATVVDDPIGLLSKVAKFKIIVRCSDSSIVPTSAELDMFNGLYKHMGLLTVMREWVLDSLGSYRLQPLIEYVLNTGVTNVPF